MNGISRAQIGLCKGIETSSERKMIKVIRNIIKCFEAKEAKVLYWEQLFEEEFQDRCGSTRSRLLSLFRDEIQVRLKNGLGELRIIVHLDSEHTGFTMFTARPKYRKNIKVSCVFKPTGKEIT